MMKAVTALLILTCTLGVAQEHSNFGYTALAREAVSNAGDNHSVAGSSSCTTGKVTVTTPQNGQQLSSPVLFQASATPDTGLTITRMQIHVDGVSVYSVNGAVVNTSLTVSAGAHKVVITATQSNATTLSSATINITVTTGVVATFKGCVYNQNAKYYQGVAINLSQPATVTFDANLYYGSTCNPSQWADEFGFGQTLSLGTFTYFFWFTDFSDQLNMSAIWKINNQTSGCVNYAVAPPC
jgi:hypothetical protein